MNGNHVHFTGSVKYACRSNHWSSALVHPEGTSIGSDICDFLKVSDFNGSLWNVKVFPLKII